MHHFLGKACNLVLTGGVCQCIVVNSVDFELIVHSCLVGLDSHHVDRLPSALSRVGILVPS